MPDKPGNYAFIDSQNLNLSIFDQGWKLDYKRFRKYLDDKYQKPSYLLDTSKVIMIYMLACKKLGSFVFLNRR